MCAREYTRQNRFVYVSNEVATRLVLAQTLSEDKATGQYGPSQSQALTGLAGLSVSTSEVPRSGGLSEALYRPHPLGTVDITLNIETDPLTPELVLDHVLI